MRVCLVAEESRPLGAQLQDLGDQLVVVGGAAAVAAVHEHPPDLLAQRAILGVGQEGLDARTRIQHRPLALVTARPGGAGRRGAQPG
jgi:hypothetical protein